MDTIETARAHGDLDQYATLRGIVLTYQRSILEYVYESEELDPATTRRDTGESSRCQALTTR